MAKKLQITIDDESEKIIDRLKVKQTKSFFTSMAIKNFAQTKEGKNFLNDTDQTSIENIEDKKISKGKNENHFLPKDKKVKLEGWN